MYIDAHAHIEFQAFAQDWEETIHRAISAGVSLVNVGTQRDTSRRAIEIAEQFPSGVYATVGLHPIQTERLPHFSEELGLNVDDARAASSNYVFRSRGELFDSEHYEHLARHPKVLMIGECGLDYYRCGDNTKKVQMLAFDQQIELAHKVGKPLMIHCRHAYPDLIEFLRSRIPSLDSRAPGICHFFTGETAEAHALIDLGFYVTFGGAITRGSEYDDVVREVPIERLLSETDAPYVTPAQYGGRRNEPLFVTAVVDRMAEIKNVSHEAMRLAIWENFQRLAGPMLEEIDR